MMKRETIAIADVYVPIKRRATLEQKRVDEIAASILDKGLQTPILVRADGARFVLVEGLHRLEAAKALGEKTIVSFLVDAPKHWRRLHSLFPLQGGFPESPEEAPFKKALKGAR
jgi:sulfiredoxin